TRRHADKLQDLVSSIEQAGGEAHAFGCDARIEDEMVQLFAGIERDIGPIEVVVFNIGANVRFSITETTERVYRKVWEMAALSGFLTGREAAKAMLPRGVAPSSSPAPPPRCAVAAVSAPSPVPNSHCV